MFSRTFTRASSRIGQASRSQWAGASLRRGYAEEARAQAIPVPPAAKSSGGGARIALYGLVFTTLGAVGTYQLMSRHGLGFYSDEESLARFTPGDEQARQIEEAMNSHPLVAQLRARPDLIESRPHMKMPGSYRAKHLTGGVLQGPDKVPVPPLIWADKEGKELTCIMFAGDTLCGHPGIVHGGFLATMLDEGLARCCFAQLPHNIGVTANLNIDYRKPTPAGNFLVLRADTVKVEGRKAWVEGRIESLVKPGEKATVYAEAKALFISPKFAAMMPKPI